MLLSQLDRAKANLVPVILAGSMVHGSQGELPVSVTVLLHDHHHSSHERSHVLSIASDDGSDDILDVCSGVQLDISCWHVVALLSCDYGPRHERKERA